jgi:ParB/RepB/Spo0J family partition protein
MKKIKVCNLCPNPHRGFTVFPPEDESLDQERIEGLKESITDDEFWGGIPVRPHPTKKDKYEIGSGHHRLAALMECGVESIEAPVINYSDAQMLRVMIRENAEYSKRPKLVLSDVKKAKTFIDNLLERYDTWEEARSHEDVRAVFKSREQWAAPAGRKSCGENTITQFLGKGSIKAWMVREALAVMDAKDFLNEKAVEQLPTVEAATRFRKAVKAFDVPKQKQVNLAKKVAKNLRKKGHGVRDIAKQVAEEMAVAIVKKPDTDFEEIKKVIEAIDKDARTLKNRLVKLRRLMDALEVQELRGVQAWLAASSLNLLLKEIGKAQENEQ